MRTMNIDDVEAGTREKAEKVAPWAAVIVRVVGGWIAFESVSDYETWRWQK